MEAIKTLTERDVSRLLKRGVSEIISQEEMITLLRSGKKLRLKEGFDPSFPDIHLGHVVGLRKLRQFQELGHQVVLIVGDWTAQIGDPSGVSVTRPILTAEQVKANAETYMRQFFKIVDKSKTEVRWQTEWFGKFTLADIIKLASKFTVAQFLAREDFAVRYAAQRPIALTELLYPLLQAYDSVAVKSDVEFGGQDQKFNFLVGRELQSMMGQPRQQCFMTPLLVGTDGSHKMSKSLGNYIGVDEAPEQIYGKVMSIADSLILQYFELITDVSDAEIADFKKQIEGGANPMTLKKRLGREIVALLHSQEAAAEAEEQFEKVVQKKDIPDEIEEFRFSFEGIAKSRAQGTRDINEVRRTGGKIFFNQFDDGAIGHVGVDSDHLRNEIWDVSRIVVYIGHAKSRSDASKLIAQGAVSIDGKKITGNLAEVRSGSIIKVGKRRFARVINTDQIT